MRAQQRITVPSNGGSTAGAPRRSGFVDYSLQRQALLRDVYTGKVGTSEVCDASPYLKSAARFHGEATEQRCPICRREYMINVHYIYGDQLKQSAGQARSRAELAALADTLGEFQVYVVEVCRGCDWNHLVEQYLLGRAHRTAPQPSAAATTATSPTGTV
ncbi:MULTISPECIES: DUF5318 family protein [Catellatospora]|uniref:DUF5318 domain-containing protein n=1 Tax=Catellatospora bangladeshensis TaxID=310355 RepID=A0A8J3JWT5_9ACTN|nr:MULTISPECIES: DUF5318 family protein [Catellatospora]BCJ71788.1 hypothetical protein CS0771_13320 [Catellatospora sp. IY07-71]GIF84534.1 hypothetical protein Cba03nite_58830 [Catellatospora bangladeshensis]